MMARALLLVQILCCLVTSPLAHREHKVHNIVLYPDKQSWCKTTPIKQVVTSPGYKPVTIDNNVCVGACFSYSIPQTQPAEPGELIVPYCDSCQPVDTRCYHVTLQVEDESFEGPKTVQKRVQIINNCTCLSCEKNTNTDCELSQERTAELPIDLFSTNRDSEIPVNTDEVPELLNFLPNKTRNDTHNLNFDVNNITTKQQKFEINSKLIALLKSIQEGDDSPNFNYDKAQLTELLNIIEGSEHQLSDKNLMEFVNFINFHNSEDLELDLSKLKEVLTNFQKTELRERHKSFGLGPLDSKHISIDVSNSVDGFTKRHFLGERQKLGLGVGQLVRGPHGSLVLQQEHPGEEKLNVEPHMLRPNHEGTVVSYENHEDQDEE